MTLPRWNRPTCTCSIQMPHPNLMVMVSFCWKMNFLPSKIKNKSVLLMMSLKLIIEVVAFFLGHPVLYEITYGNIFYEWPPPYQFNGVSPITFIFSFLGDKPKAGDSIEACVLHVDLSSRVVTLSTKLQLIEACKKTSKLKTKKVSHQFSCLSELSKI